jgi:hypothetical protein
MAVVGCEGRISVASSSAVVHARDVSCALCGGGRKGAGSGAEVGAG